MLTIVEFFSKKKINLKAIEKEQPELYVEFVRDYSQMGEKSFDHSKKFWFNKLRKQYLLADEPIVVETKLQQSGSVEKPVDNPSISSKPSGFKPKFKSSISANEQVSNEDNSKPISTDTTNDIPEPVHTTPASTSSNPGFKPRFNASQLPKPVEEVKESPAQESNSADEASSSSNKPAGFKPRFKASQPPKPVDEEKDSSADEIKTTEEVSTSSNKPAGFKPRFKASQPPKPVEEVKDNPTEETKAAEEVNPTSNKPAGFKPRFKASQLPKPVEELKESTAEEIKEADEASPTSNKPAGFKPRFKASQLPKPVEETKQNSTLNEEPTLNNDSATNPSIPDEKQNIHQPEEKSDNISHPKPLGFKPKFKSNIKTNLKNDNEGGTD